MSGGQAVAAGGHGAKVAAGRGVDIDLGRHHPVPGCVALEGDPGALDCGRRRHRREDGIGVEHRDLGHGEQVSGARLGPWH